MKRILTSIAFVLCALAGHAQYSGSGSGTESDPYLIFNETQLSQMANFLGQEGVVFRLMKNLDLTNWIAENSPSQGWLPIGVESSPFKGVLLGEGHTISGLSITRPNTDNVGFFGYLDGATISNLTIEGTNITGADYTGGFVGNSVNSSLSNCHISLSGKVTCVNYSGGFAGRLTDGSSISNCSVGTKITSSGNNVGGFAGKAIGSTIANASQSGDVTASQGIGGFLGSNSGSTVSSITATGQVTGTLFVAGVCGLNQGTVNYTNCKHTGNINGHLAVGGILGKMESGCTATLTSCASKGIITNTGDYTGGIIAMCDGGKIAGIESCSHFGDITGQNYVGGLIGAVLSSLPTIHTYTWRNWRNGSSNSSIVSTFYDQIENGTSQESPINNSVAIGNIIGNNYVGGLIGMDVPYYFYRYGVKKTYNSTYTNGYSNGYLYKDGVYVDKFNSSSNQYSYSYARDIVSLALTNNYYSGTIHGAEFVGGLAGQKSGGQITNNYSYASVFGSSNVGGIVGQITDDVNTTYNLYNQTTIKSNVANCAIMSATSTNVGRIYGAVDNAEHATIGALGSADGNRALTTAQVVCQGVTQDITDNLQNGNSIGPSLLRLKATYVAMGWDFDNNWDILETESFPYKTFQTAPPVIESDLVSQATNISGKSVDGGTVYLFYKDREAVETNCVENHWTFTTEALQSGAQVQIYAEVEGKTPSYFTTANVAFPGSGTEDDPYRIYTAEDLQGATKAAYYKLMNDIDLTSWIAENSPTTGWVAVGRNSGNGTYIDGGNHKITGLWINSNEDYTGLFSNYSSGRIKNLTVEVANGKKVKGGNYTGILVGRFANGQIENCIVTGDVEGTQYVGGVVGYVTNTPLSDLSYEGEVKTSTANACVGGIAGYVNASNITNCYATTTVNATGNSSNVGGLVGKTVGGTISQTKAEANITATGTTDRVGGLVGNAQSIIEQSLSTGNVVASGDNSYTGGLVGLTQDHTVGNCYSTVVVTGTEYSAGLIGYANNTAIDKCYAKGNIEGVMYGAGVVGELEAANATLTNSVALNNILALSAQSSWGSRVIGGYKNGAADPDESNYALATMQVSLNNVPQTKTDDLVEGIAKSEADLLTAATYIDLGWDFSTVWSIDEGNACPKLQWEDGVTPPSFLVPGDANGDNTVNVTDYVCIANYILGQSTGFFDTTAADVNEDGSVNVSDYVGVANIILYGRYTGQAANSIKALNSESSSTWLEAQNGEDGQLTLQLHDAKAFVAFQMDIQLPEGVTIKEATMAKANQTPNLGVANLGNGTWRLLYGTLTNKDVKLNDGNLLTLRLSTNGTHMGGSLIIDNIFLTKANTNTQQLDAILAGLPTGIRSIKNGLDTRTIYDLTGRKVEKMQRGIYIVNGKKVSVK